MLNLKIQYFGYLMWRTDSLNKSPWCWERLKVRGDGNERGWDGWMASPTQWTWVCVSSGSWWWTEKPRVLQSMGSQRVGVTELNWTVCGNNCSWDPELAGNTSSSPVAEMVWRIPNHIESSPNSLGHFVVWLFQAEVPDILEQTQYSSALLCECFNHTMVATTEVWHGFLLSSG